MCYKSQLLLQIILLTKLDSWCWELCWLSGTLASVCIISLAQSQMLALSKSQRGPSGQMRGTAGLGAFPRPAPEHPHGCWVDPIAAQPGDTSHGQCWDGIALDVVTPMSSVSSSAGLWCRSGAVTLLVVPPSPSGLVLSV